MCLCLYVKLGNQGIDGRDRGDEDAWASLLAQASKAKIKDRKPSERAEPRQQPPSCGCGGSRWERVGSAFNLKQNWYALLHRPDSELNVDGLAMAPKSLPPLDGMRALAVLWVMLLHSMSYWGQLANAYDPTYKDWSNSPALGRFWSSPLLRISTIHNGQLGVDVFFCLSGFLITFLLLKELDHTRTISAWQFLLRRWLRLMPAYCSCIGLAMWLLPEWTNSYGTGCTQYVWTNLLFLNNMYGTDGCLGQSWSIAVEFQFYLVSPFIVLAMGSADHDRPSSHVLIRGLLVPSSLFVICLVYRALIVVNNRQNSGWAGTPGDMWLYCPVWARMAPYLSGMAAAFVYARCCLQRLGEDEDPDQPGTTAVAVSVVVCPAVLERVYIRWLLHAFFGPAYFWIACSNRPDPLWARPLFGCAVSYFMLCTLVGKARVLTTVLSHAVWVPFARLSYNAYLLQFIPMAWIATFPSFSLQNKQNATAAQAWGVFLLFQLAYVPLVFALALLVHLAVEKPLMNLRPRR